MNRNKHNDFRNENKTGKMLDRTDHEIIALLNSNARLQWQEIGDLVHLTGQAVANRVRRLEHIGIIQGFSIQVDENLLGKPLLAYVTMFMKTTDHQGFQKFLKDNSMVKEAHRVSGEGCYLLKLLVADQTELTNLLDSMLVFGNCRVNLSIGKVK